MSSQQDQAETIDPLSKVHTPVQNREVTMKSPKTLRTKKPQRMRLTRSRLVYSGPSAILSHLYKATFTIDDTPYNSVEQKLQYEKAMNGARPTGYGDHYEHTMHLEN